METAGFASVGVSSLLYQFVSNSASDVDECSNGDDDCDVNAACTNQQGSFSCECTDGFQGNGKICEGIKKPVHEVKIVS